MRSIPQHLLPCLLLIAVTAAIYSPVLHHGFLDNWDDEEYVTTNVAAHGLSWSHLNLAFTSYFVGHYAPLPIVSYMLDYEIWGLRAPGFLLTNLLIHLANGLLLYALVIRQRAKRGVAFLGTALFLCHPVQVESVAWVSQRKTLLALFFFLSALHLYARYRQRQWNSGRWTYLGSLLAFGLALLSKPAAVVLPITLVLFDLCFEGRQGCRVRLWDKVPYALLALAAAVVALYSQSPEHGGGRGGYHGGSPASTALTMLTVLLRYLHLLFWPTSLSAIYLPPIRQQADPLVVLALLAVLVFIFLGIYLYRRQRRLFFWYALIFVALLPVLQIVPMISLMNDRYLYFPMIGAAPLLAAAVMAGLDRVGGKWPRFLPGGVVAALAALCMLSFLRVQVWRDSITLWKDTVQKQPESKEAWYGLADAYHARSQWSEALAAYSRSLSIDPRYPEAAIGAGILFREMGDLDRSRQLIGGLLQQRPDHAEGWLHLGRSHHLAGEPENAEAAYRRALELQPRMTGALVGLVSICRAQRRFAEARQLYGRAQGAGIRDAGLEYELACIAALEGAEREALQHLEKALSFGYNDFQRIRSDPDLDSLRHGGQLSRLLGSG